MLASTKCFFIPVVNPDGNKYIEDKYDILGKIANKRKNMNPKYLADCGDEDGGTDLNRNWGVDWMAMVESENSNKCGEFWPGISSFSEPETTAVRNFIE